MAKKPKDPASAEADALREGDFLPSNSDNSPNSMVVVGGLEARALPLKRMTIDRIDGEESILIDKTRYHKDLGIGKIAGFSRPRNIRATIKKLMKSGDINQANVICLDDDDGNQVYYLDQSAGMELLVNVRGINKQMIMAMLGKYGAAQEPIPQAISQKDALYGYDRITTFIARKDIPHAAKLMKLPLLDCYCRAAGIPIPDVSKLLGPDQPRLEGV